MNMIKSYGLHFMSRKNFPLTKTKSDPSSVALTKAFDDHVVSILNEFPRFSRVILQLQSLASSP